MAIAPSGANSMILVALDERREFYRIPQLQPTHSFSDRLGRVGSTRAHRLR